MGKIQTVLGAIDPEELGLTLVHEHIMCDFIGASKVSKDRYDPDEVFRVMLPYLLEIRQLDVRGFVDCTPMYLGRDVEVLARLAKATGIHILTNTGLYKEPFLPSYAWRCSVDRLARMWMAEIKEGIEGMPIRAGFIKIAVNPGPLIPMQQKIVRTAARTCLATGATIACHTANGVAALEVLDVLDEEDVLADNLIVVHSDAEQDQGYHFETARRGAWVEYDGLKETTAEKTIGLIKNMVEKGYEDRLLLSQDAGWYNVGQEKGGKIRGYAYLVKEFLPLMRKAGFNQELIHKVLVENPARAFQLK